MKRSLSICFYAVILHCFFLFGCITKWEAKETDEFAGILVVEGIITDDQSVIRLSQSKGLSYKDYGLDQSPYHVTDAKVYIECGDGTQWGVTAQNLGEYTIETGKLNPERQYRLKIEHEKHEYLSEFACPMVTPEIDSVFWTKRGSNQPVNIHVAMHVPDSMMQYCIWKYREDWEIIPYYTMDEKCPRCDISVGSMDNCPICGFEIVRRYPSFCWNKEFNREVLLGSTEKTGGRLVEQITQMRPTDIQLEILYRIEVMQNAICKRAYDYFTNIKKNAQQTGGIFSQIPMELRGNMICATDQSRTVIGYVDVSTVMRKKLWITRLDDAFERELFYCREYFYWELMRLFPNGVPLEYIYNGYAYVFISCVKCTYGGASIQSPDGWPDTKYFPYPNINENEEIYF